MQSNLSESDRHIFGETKCAAKIQIAFGFNSGGTQWNAERSCDRAERNARTRDQRFEQHVSRARSRTVAAGRGMQPRFDQRFSSLDPAGNIFAHSTARPQRDESGFRSLAIARLEWRLHGFQLISIHPSLRVAQLPVSA